MKLSFLPFLCLFIFVLACKTELKDTTSPFDYPQTPKGDHVDEYHGIKVNDPYQWLEDDRSEETSAWVTAQNKVTFDYLEGIGFRKRLKSRLESLMDYEKYSPPFQGRGLRIFLQE